MGQVSAAYAGRAADYIDALGRIECTAEQDRAMIGAWAGGVDGLVLDVGCGPGHWTAWLQDQGRDAEGIDPVAAFIDHARAAYPRVSFRVGRAEHLDVADDSVGGILAWYSLIHTPPADIPAVLGEFARVLAPGGSLAVGFFDGPDLTPFNHQVTTAYFWPIAALTQRIEDAGFTVTARHSRTDPGARPHAAIVARRQPTGRIQPR